MKRSIALVGTVFLMAQALHADVPRSHRQQSAALEGPYFQHPPRRGKAVALIETSPSYSPKNSDFSQVAQSLPSDSAPMTVAALPSPAAIAVPDNFPLQQLEALLTKEEPVIKFGLPSSKIVPMDSESSDFVLAKEKTLSPTLEDGVNDEAVFGPGAEEVTIKDVTGHRVFHARRNGIASLRWDCRGPAGKIVDEGVYFVLALNQEGVEFRQSFTVIR